MVQTKSRARSFHRPQVSLAVLVALSMPAAAVPDGEAAEGWHPFDGEIAGPRARGLDASEREHVAANIKAAKKVLEDSDAIVDGAEVRPSASVASRRGGQAEGPLPVTYRLDLRVHRPSVEEARRPGGRITLRFNSPYVMVEEVFADETSTIHLEPPAMDAVAGNTLYRLSSERERHLKVGWNIAQTDEPPWVPVTRERWIKALMAHASERLADFERETTSKAEDRRARFERAYESMKDVSSENARQIREQFEANEERLSQALEALRAGDHDALERAGRRDLAMISRAKISLEEELEAMSAAERAAPAHCCQAPPNHYFSPPPSATRASLMLDESDDGARALVAPNPAFFSADLPSHSAQSITVTMQTPIRDEAWHAYMEAVREDVDWEKLAR